jgi:hypothetical protein
MPHRFSTFGTLTPQNHRVKHAAVPIPRMYSQREKNPPFLSSPDSSLWPQSEQIMRILQFSLLRWLAESKKQGKEKTYLMKHAGVAEQVDAQDLKSWVS